MLEMVFFLSWSLEACQNAGEPGARTQKGGSVWQWLCGARYLWLGASSGSLFRRRRREIDSHSGPPLRVKTAPVQTVHNKPSTERSRKKLWICRTGSALRPIKFELPIGVVVNTWRVEQTVLLSLCLPSVHWGHYPKQLGGGLGWVVHAELD